MPAFYHSLRRCVLAACFGLASACSSGGGADGGAEVQPVDFALTPCGGSVGETPCAVVMAGGKRILMGAPAGIGETLGNETLGNLDAVMLFSLRASHIEGLDEVRNRSWQLGRDTQLRVIGPDGTQDVIAAINQAYEVSDAELFLENRRAGGFNAPLLVDGGANPGTRIEVFNTGDLSVTRVINARGQAGYWVDYGGKRALLEPCGMDQASKFAGEVDLSVGCEAERDKNWPIQEVIFIDLEQDIAP